MKPYIISSIASLCVTLVVFKYSYNLDQLYTETQFQSGVAFALSVLLPLLLLLTAKNLLSLCLGQDAILFAYHRLKQGR